jgi:hypothetical protein
MFVTPSLAVSPLLVLALASSAGGAAKLHRITCGAAAPAAGTVVVPRLATPVAAAVSGPRTIDMHAVPGIRDAPATAGAPPELPSPGIARARRLKADARSACVPQSAPTMRGLPATR